MIGGIKRIAKVTEKIVPSMALMYIASALIILALVFPNMIGLLVLFPKVRSELKRYLDAIKDSTKGKKPVP